MSDYVRQVSTGFLHRVKYEANGKYYTTRLSDGESCAVDKEDAEVVTYPALFPTDFETRLKQDKRRKP